MARLKASSLIETIVALLVFSLIMGLAFQLVYRNLNAKNLHMQVKAKVYAEAYFNKTLKESVLYQEIELEQFTIKIKSESPFMEEDYLKKLSVRVYKQTQLLYKKEQIICRNYEKP